MKCLVCQHPDRDPIDTLLRSGATFQEILSRFDGFSERTLRRHKADHLSVKLPPIPRNPADIPEDLLTYGLGVLLGSISTLSDLVTSTAHVRGAEALTAALRCLLEYNRALEDRKATEDPGELHITITRAFPPEDLNDD